MDEYEREKDEKKLFMKLQEAEEAVKDGEGWLSFDESKVTMELEISEQNITEVKVRDARGSLATMREKYNL